MSTRRSKLPEDQPPEEQPTDEPIEADDTTEAEEPSTPSLPPAAFEFTRGRCPQCSEKISTNLEGALFCPVQNKECPRYVSSSV